MSSFYSIIGDVLVRSGTIYLGVAMGYIFIKTPLNKYRTNFVNITINILTPFLIFVSMIRIEPSSEWIFPVFGAVIVTITGIYTPKIISKFDTSKQNPSPAELCTSTFSNALNFPFPIIFAFAPNGLGAAGIFLAISIIARNTIGFWISGVKINKESIKTITLFPPIWAIFTGLLVRIFAFENNVVTGFNEAWVVEILFQIAIFATLMTIGFGLHKPNFEYKFPIFRVGMTRYVFSGILAFVTVLIFKPQATIGIPLIVQMIAPPAVYNGLYAEKFDLDTELTAQVIISLTLVALVFLPLELVLIELIY